MSFIFSVIFALASFIVFFTVKARDGEKQKEVIRSVALTLGILMTIAIILRTISRFLIIIPAGEVGVSEILGSVSKNTLGSGIHLVNPLADVETFSTRLQDIKETVDTTSKEGLTFNIDVSLQYRLDPQKAGEVYQKIGNNEKDIIVSRFRSLIRQITAKYDLITIYGEKRPEIALTLKQEMVKQLRPLGFIVEETLLRNIILPDNIQAAIQSKVATEQENQKLDLEIAKAKKDAERKKVEAQGTAASQKILSDGLTDKILTLKAIEATQKLAESQNSKIIIMGGGQDKLPLILPEK
jgi:regulator of protease activity HflC (stomatin/prohibitin superfamily)